MRRKKNEKKCVVRRMSGLRHSSKIYVHTYKSIARDSTKHRQIINKTATAERSQHSHIQCATPPLRRTNDSWMKKRENDIVQIKCANSEVNRENRLVYLAYFLLSCCHYIHIYVGFVLLFDATLLRLRASFQCDTLHIVLIFFHLSK